VGPRIFPFAFLLAQACHPERSLPTADQVEWIWPSSIITIPLSFPHGVESRNALAFEFLFVYRFFLLVLVFVKQIRYSNEKQAKRWYLTGIYYCLLETLIK
jgi:hypothetical protein